MNGPSENQDGLPPLRRDARGKRPNFYSEDGTDYAMSMILVLAQEFSVLRDRLDTVEEICEEKGVVLSEEIENHRPSEASLLKRERRRQDLLGRLYYLARKEVSEFKEKDSTERYKEVLAEIAES